MFVGCSVLFVVRLCFAVDWLLLVDCCVVCCVVCCRMFVVRSLLSAVCRSWLLDVCVLFAVVVCCVVVLFVVRCLLFVVYCLWVVVCR